MNEAAGSMGIISHKLLNTYSAHAHVEIPEELEGSWPYTKADGFKHKTKLCRFYETGMKNMPAGELEGLGIAEIRARYESGRIPPHFRIQA